MKAIHCIYTIGIASSWNCCVNKRVMGKLSCGEKKCLLINITSDKLRKNIAMEHSYIAPDYDSFIGVFFDSVEQRWE